MRCGATASVGGPSPGGRAPQGVFHQEVNAETYEEMPSSERSATVCRPSQPVCRVVMRARLLKNLAY